MEQACVSGTAVACGDAGASSWSDSKSTQGGISSALPRESKIGGRLKERAF